MALLLLLWLLCAGTVESAFGEPSQATASKEVKGDVLYWEAEDLVVKDILGREVRIRVTADTKILGASGRLKTGDKIVAQVPPEGPAVSITLQIPDSGPPVR